MPTLILSPRFTEDSQALWRAAGELGWNVERLTSWRFTEEIRSLPDPVLYVEALLAPTLAEELGLVLIEPPVHWLPKLPEEYRKRNVDLTTLGDARQLVGPAFVKPPNDKSFPARVYLPAELPAGYDEEMPVLVAEVVSWEKEFRCFVLDRKPRTLSIYLREGQPQRDNNFATSAAELAEAEAFVSLVLRDPRIELPPATVIDVGIISGRGWAVVEQNAAWGSGIYGCDPVQVLEVLMHSAVRTRPEI